MTNGRLTNLISFGCFTCVKVPPEIWSVNELVSPMENEKGPLVVILRGSMPLSSVIPLTSEKVT